MADNYEIHVATLFSGFHDLWSNLNVKLSFLYSNFDIFLEKLGPVSDEEGQQFHYDLKYMGESY